ncbi:MAG: TolC family protein, partial [Pseudomonadota bacterium]
MRFRRGIFPRAMFVLALVAPGTRGASGAAPATAPAAATAAPDNPGPPRPPRPLALTDVLTRAATDNPDLLRERVAIDIANANVRIAEGSFDFTLTGDGTFARRVNPAIPGSTGTGSLTAGLAETFTANLGLTRALESGGRVSIGAQEIATRTSQIQVCGLNAAGTVCTYHSSSLALTFTHPLLRGFGAEVTLANLRKQRILRDTELLNRQAQAAVVIRDVVTTYWELGYAADDLAIRRSAVKLAEEQRRYTQAQVDVGKLGLADLAAVDRAIADRQQDVAVAEQTMLLRSLDLERLIGRQVPPDFTAAAPTERPSPTPAIVDTVAETTHALASSPQLRALRAGLTLSEIDVRTALALVRPQLDFTGSVGTAGRQLGLGDAWAQAGRFENINWSAGLAFQFPLQNRAARGAEQAARATGERANIDVADLELGIRDGVVRLSAAARTAVRRGELARAAVGYAGKNLEAERARFDVGRATNNDVLLRQQELKNAEIQVARAATDLANAETALAALTGDILERYGVVLRG